MKVTKISDKLNIERGAKFPDGLFESFNINDEMIYSLPNMTGIVNRFGEEFVRKKLTERINEEFNSYLSKLPESVYKLKEEDCHKNFEELREELIRLKEKLYTEKIDVYLNFEDIGLDNDIRTYEGDFFILNNLRGKGKDNYAFVIPKQERFITYNYNYEDFDK